MVEELKKLKNIMNNIKNLKFPILLLDKKNNIIDFTKNNEHLEVSTKLGLKKKILLDTLIFDSNDKAYIIREVKDLGLKNPIWKFEFFNPMHNINVSLEDIAYNVKELKGSIITILKNDNSVWEEFPFKKSLIKEIERSKSIKEVINCFILSF